MLDSSLDSVIESLPPLLVVGLAWSVGFGVIAGIGQWIRLLFRLRSQGDGAGFSAFWVGYCALIALLQGWWLVAPITGLTAAVVALIGGGGSLIAFWRGRVPVSRGSVLQFLLILIVLIGIGGWVASRALDPRMDFDSVFYHVSAIRWRNEYPVIVGLGNLHYRLAFNQSFFLFCAWLNVPFGNGAAGYGYTIANSLLLMAAVGTCAQAIFAGLGAVVQRKPVPAALVSGVYGVLCLPLLIFRAAPQPYSFNISSPSPDLGVYIFQIIIGLEALRLLYSGRAALSVPTARFRLALILALAMVSVTQKLSGVAFSASLVVFLLGWALWQGRDTLRKTLRRVVLIGSAATVPIVLPWLVIGVLTSGYLAFPNTFGAFPVDYQIPLETTVEARDWVYSWARYPVSSSNSADVLSSFDWLPTWIRLLFIDPTSVFLFVIPILLFAAFMLLYLLALLIRRGQGYDRRPWLILFPSLIGGLFWWFSAPDPRFAGVVFWLLTVSAFLLCAGVGRRRFLIVAAGCIALSALIVVDGYGTSFAPRDRLPQVNTGPVVEFTTETGFSFYVSADPDANLQMGDPPLPSSVYRIPGVELRGVDLRDGLRTRP